MALRACKLVAAMVAVSLITACAESRIMTLAAAPADLYDPSAPLRVTGSQSVTGRHGHVIAGAGEGAAKGFLGGGFGAIAAGAQSHDPFGLVLGILIAPVTAVGGGIVGATAAHPAEETKSAVAAIEKVYADKALLAGITRDVEQRVSRLGFPAAPTCAEAEVSDRGCPLGRTNHLHPTTTYAFRTKGGYSPHLRLAINVDATAANADPKREAADHRWAHVSPKLDFFVATREDAKALRAQVADVQRLMAARIVNDLFTARHKVRIAGVIRTDAGWKTFQPSPSTPGVVTRWPTEMELASAEGSDLRKGSKGANTKSSKGAGEPAMKTDSAPAGRRCVERDFGGPKHPWDDLACTQAGM